MGLLPDTQNNGLCMRRECRERFPCKRLQRKQQVSDPGMHHDTRVTHVPWYMWGSLNHGGGENVPSIPGACATRNFTYLARGPWKCRRLCLCPDPPYSIKIVLFRYSCIQCILMRLSQNPWIITGRLFADDIFRCIFVNEKFCILIKVSLKFVPKGPIDNNPAFV